MEKHTNILQRRNYERAKNKEKMRRMEIIDNFKRTNKKIKRKTILEIQNELAQAILKK